MDINSEIVYFSKNSIYEIGNIRYQVNSHFDKAGENLKEKVKRLLKNEVLFKQL